MDLKTLVELAEKTHRACGWNGGGQFELEPNTTDLGSLVAYFEVHKTKLDDATDQLTVLQEIRDEVEMIWGLTQKGIEFWRYDQADSGMILTVWLDRGTPD